MGDPTISAGAIGGGLIGAVGGWATSSGLDGADARYSKGARGPAVENIQKELNAAGFNLAVDGNWGDQTEAAVRAFQQQRGLQVDGVVGPKTSAALQTPAAKTVASSSSAKEPGFDVQKQLSNPDSQLSVAIGHAEGNRTPQGGFTLDGAGHRNSDGHTDPVNHAKNVGTFSLQKGPRNAAEADQTQLACLREMVPVYQQACKKAGLDPTNPMLAATFFDLYNQSPKAVVAKGGLVDQFPKLAEKGITQQTLTQARIESWRDPGTQHYDHKFSSDQVLIQDQKRRMGCLAEVLRPATAAAKSGETKSPEAKPADTGKISLNSTGPQVIELKQALKDAGFYKGPINDKMGQQGIDALKLAKQSFNIGGPADVAGSETLQKIRDSSAGGLTGQLQPQRQWDPTSCGLACIAMIATAANGKTVTDQNLRARWGSNFSLVNVLNSETSAAKSPADRQWKDFGNLGNQVNWDQLAKKVNQEKSPVIIGLGGPDFTQSGNHFVLIKEIKGDKVTILDPATGEKRDVTKEQIMRDPGHSQGKAILARA